MYIYYTSEFLNLVSPVMKLINFLFFFAILFFPPSLESILSKGFKILGYHSFSTAAFEAILISSSFKTPFSYSYSATLEVLQIVGGDNHNNGSPLASVGTITGIFGKELE